MEKNRFQILPKEYRSPIWVIVLGISFTIYLFLYSNGWEKSFAKSRFNESANRIFRHIHLSADSHIKQIKQISNHKFYTIEDFKNSVSFGIKNNPGTLAIQWLHYVPYHMREQFEAEIQHFETKGFKITRREKSDSKRFFLPVYYQKSTNKQNTDTLGYDPVTDKISNTIFKLNKTPYSIRVCSFILKEENNNSTIESYLPTYRVLSDGEKQLSGLLRAKFDLKKIVLNGIENINDESVKNIKFGIFDIANKKPLFRDKDFEYSFSSSDTTVKKTIVFGNLKLGLIFSPKKISLFSNAAEYIPLIILIGGLFITLTLGIYLIYLVKKTRKDIEKKLEPVSIINNIENSSSQISDEIQKINAIWAIDKNGITTFANEQLIEMLGLKSIDDIIGQHVYKFMDNDAKKASLTNLNKHKANIHEDYNIDLQLLNGSKIPVIMSITPFFDDNGKYDGALANVTPDHTIGLTANELRIHETRLRALTENINDITVIIDQNNKLCYASPSLEKITGYSASKLLGMSIYDFIEKDDTALIRQSLDRISREIGKRLNIKEIKILDKEGNQIFFDGTITNMSDVPGINGIIFNGRNITDKKNISAIETAHAKTLEKISEDKPLSESLKIFIEGVEQVIPESLCSICTINETSNTISTCAAPSLPAFFNDAMDGVTIAENNGAAAKTAALNEPQIMSDITLQPQNLHWRELLSRAGLRSCWSFPIMTTAKKTTGVLTLYFHNDRAPESSELEIVQTAANLAGITIERKLSEDALRESEIRWRSIIAHLPDYVGLLDLKGNFIFANKVAPGFAIEEVMGTNIFDYVENDHKEAFKETMNKVLQTGKPHSYEIPLNSPEGIIWWSNRIGLMKSDGNTIGFVTVGTDITNRKEIELSLKKLSGAVEQSGSAIIIINTSGNIEYVNPKFSDITGYSADEAINKQIDLFQHEADGDSHEFWETILSGKSWHGEVKNKRKNGEIYWTLISVSPIFDEEKHITHFVVISDDLTKLKETQTEVERLSFYDTLTGLGNRKLFKEKLKDTLKNPDKNIKYALLYLDLDQFKKINDTLGHDAGDNMLKLIAEKIINIVTVNDIVSRFGGDEFAILLKIQKTSDAGNIARKILEELNDPINIMGQDVLITTSIGITVAPDDTENPEVLMKNADLAMYRAKELGRNNYQYYTDEMNVEVLGRLFLENELRLAVESKQFTLYFQPQIRIKDQSVTGIEALIRWNHPQRGLIAPDQFINVAEETGMIIPLGRWIINHACKVAKSLHDQQIPPVKVAVNLSVKQFQDPSLPSVVENALRESGLPPNYLQLEITESMLMDSIEASISMLKTLKDFGISLSIDDFGTGYSSLSYIKKLPIDEIKVDKSFVRDIPEDQNDMEITAAVIAMAHKLNLRVVAEGVETVEQLDFLKRNDCDFIQGYLFSKPVSEENIAQIIKE